MLLLPIMLSNQVFVLSYAESLRFSIVPSSSPIKSVEKLNIIRVDNFGF